MRIVRLANFITPYSGGLRTALRELGAGYAAAGHEPVLVMPGAAPGAGGAGRGGSPRDQVARAMSRA
jgi:alpha-1,6-mannosyltransferase